MSADGRPKALISWSSGKDSAFTLAVLREQAEFEVVGLVTTINSSFRRVAMHAVREDVLELQAEAVGVPLWKVPIPWPCPNDAYELAMTAVVERAVAQGIRHMAFGDLFLEDIRAYREARLRGTGISPIFPLWGRDTAALAAEMIAVGVRATITCVDPSRISAAFAGREFDPKFLKELPTGADACGENGEFHTLAWDGPAFRRPLHVRTGEVVERDGFAFADVLASEAGVR